MVLCLSGILNSGFDHMRFVLMCQVLHAIDMKIAVLGGGYAGRSAALALSRVIEDVVEAPGDSYVYFC